jgi:DtxR family transcriptional regulator, Mn-dependent transcriptional regulator
MAQMSRSRNLASAIQLPATPTPVERSYLEVIAYLAARREPVLAVHLARWMRVRPPTVTHVLQRLAEKTLITRAPDGTISQTPAGAAVANSVIRRHRLIECFLHQVLGVAWHEVHREATLLEPALSPLFEERMLALLGEVTTCPHGNPIPGHADMPDDEMRLSNIAPGSWFVITRIDEEAGEDSCTLQLLWTRSLLPGTQLVRLADPVHGVAVRRADRRVVISRRVAGLLWGRSSAQG